MPTQEICDRCLNKRCECKKCRGLNIKLKRYCCCAFDPNENKFCDLLYNGTETDPNKPIYIRFGKKYKKLERDEIIKEGAMQSWCHDELNPITNADGKTIGSTPSQFSDERDFYNPI